MAFHTTYKMLQSEGLKQRMVAAAAALGEANPETWIDQQRYALVPLMLTPPDEQGASQYWWQVWEYAQAHMNENNNPDIGARTDVILDSWINQVLVTHRLNLGLIPPAP
jgi:hypothetical protein